MTDVGTQSFEDVSNLFQALLKVTRDRVGIVDATGDCLMDSDDVQAVDRAFAGRERVGKSWVDGWPEGSRTALIDGLVHARSGRTSYHRVERFEDGERQLWDVSISPVTNAGVARFLVVERNVTTEVRERERAAAVMAETRHRLKNGMTIAAGLVMLEARTRSELKSFALSVGRRFEQLAVVQDMVLDNGGSKDLPKILRLLATVYGDGSLLRIGDLPQVEMSDFAAQALALTFGELATNSLKYGALQAALPVHLDGAIEEEKLVLTWREPTHFMQGRVGGQGMQLIDRLIGAASGRVERVVGGGMLEVRVMIPVHRCR